MWSVIGRLVLRLAAVRWLFKLSGFALLVPIALLLKTIGLPLLAVLSVLAVPVFILLLLFGLPIFLVMIAGSVLMGILGIVLTIGVAAIKIGLFVVLPAFLLAKLIAVACRWTSKRDGDGPSTAAPDTSSGPSTDPA